MIRLSAVIAVLALLALSNSFSFRKFLPQDSCNNFDGQNGCQGSQTDNDPSWQNRSFQTPPRGDPLWR